MLKLVKLAVTLGKSFKLVLTIQEQVFPGASRSIIWSGLRIIKHRRKVCLFPF